MNSIVRFLERSSQAYLKLNQCIDTIPMRGIINIIQA